MSETSEPKPSLPSLQYIHAWHYDMLINQERSQFYNDLIKENCKDKIVLEIGTGAGLLAALAIKHGAKKVICCEENPLLAMAAQQLFKRLKIDDRIELISKNSKEIKTEEIPQADVILHELFGSDPFGEEVIPTLIDARRFLKPGGIYLPEKIQIIYQPLRNLALPEKLYFDDIELIEMSQLISHIHPSLRARDKNQECFSLPVVSIKELVEKPYSYVEKNPKLSGVDALEVSFMIIHENHKIQAAAFEHTGDRIHWYPLYFYKLDIQSDQIEFGIKDQVKLTVF